MTEFSVIFCGISGVWLRKCLAQVNLQLQCVTLQLKMSALFPPPVLPRPTHPPPPTFAPQTPTPISTPLRCLQPPPIAYESRPHPHLTQHLAMTSQRSRRQPSPTLKVMTLKLLSFRPQDLTPETDDQVHVASSPPIHCKKASCTYMKVHGIRLPDVMVYF